MKNNTVNQRNFFIAESIYVRFLSVKEKTRLAFCAKYQYHQKNKVRDNIYRFHLYKNHE